MVADCQAEKVPFNSGMEQVTMVAFFGGKVKCFIVNPVDSGQIIGPI